jgi:SsrA-binding protein
MSEYDKNIRTLVTENRKAYHEYFIEELYEAGIVLSGTEVKSLRNGHASIVECHISDEKGELFLYGAYIPEYDKANRFNHYPRRPRKLLLHSKEIKKLAGMVQRKGYTVVPLKLYFNQRNRAKVLIAAVKGKKLHDKRETIKQREWDRQKARVLKEARD